MNVTREHEEIRRTRIVTRLPFWGSYGYRAEHTIARFYRELRRYSIAARQSGSASQSAAG